MRTDAKVVLTTREAEGILVALATFGAMLLGDLINDDVLPDGTLMRLGVEPGPGAARRLHVRSRI